MKTPTRKQMVKAAQFLYHEEGRIEVDDEAEISRTRGDRGTDRYSGAYVQAWVWVYDDEVKNEKA